MGGNIIETTFLWKCAGASVIGIQHDRNGGKCEDAWMYYRHCHLETQYLGICVADGAGSVSKGRVGAIVASNVLSYWLTNNFNLAFSSDDEDLRFLICSAIKRPLRKLAQQSKVKLGEYACTIIGAAVCGDGRWIVVHLGDGGVVGKFGDKIDIVSFPKKGEHVNETYFITDRDAVDNIVIIKGPCFNCNDQLEGLALFTDGIEVSLINRHERKVASAIWQMLSWLSLNHESDVNASIKHNLTDVFRGRSGDDCTLVLVLKRDAQF